MRPIKFRAFSKLYGMYQGEDFPDNIFRNGEMHSEMKEDVVAVMQFTGLTDRNGKEIYEGDIVREEGVGDFKIKFDAPKYVRVCESGSYSFQNPQYMEVLGNIYENKELLSNL